MACCKPGERSRLLYAIRKCRGRKDEPKGFGQRDVRDLIVRARIPLGGPIVLVWDDVRLHDGRHAGVRRREPRVAHCVFSRPPAGHLDGQTDSLA
jgi:hypothetical protein